MQNNYMGTVIGQGKLIAVGPLTTTHVIPVKVENGQSLPSDRRACICVYCRMLGIENQTTQEYRLAERIPYGLHVRR